MTDWMIRITRDNEVNNKPSRSSAEQSPQYEKKYYSASVGCSPELIIASQRNVPFVLITSLWPEGERRGLRLLATGGDRR